MITALDPIDAQSILTPALLIYADVVRHNIQRTIDLLDGQPARWRPHLKTVKLAAMIKLLVQAGVTSAKCATTLELLTACQSGMRDVLVAFPHTGANAARVAGIAREYPAVRVSCLIESPQQIAAWQGTPIGLFIDVNPGMDRTGIAASHHQQIIDLATRIRSANLEFRGIHFYDGQAAEPSLDQRTQAAHQRYDHLLTIVSALESHGIQVPAVITAGTPAFPCALSYAPFRNNRFTHQVSPGTLVYNDTSSVTQIPEEFDFRTAVAVLTRVVSHPKRGVITCDAGHKSVSVDSGVPNCVVLGHSDYRSLKPSEEHLPIEVPTTVPAPELGDLLYLIPRHVCPTVNNFDNAAIVENGIVTSVESVTARGHEGPLLK